MKITEKVDMLQAALTKTKAIADRFPNAELISLNDGDIYYASKDVTKKSSLVEFLAPKANTIGSHELSIYEDVNIGDGVIIRVYGLPFRVKILSDIMGIIYCSDYEKSLNEAGANNLIVKKVHSYVVNYIKSTNHQIHKDWIPRGIKKILAFI